MKTLLLLIITLMITQSCTHSQPWSTQDKILQSTYLSLHTTDWAQTRNADWSTGLHETNPILGNSPSQSSIDIYFILTGLAHCLVTHILPPVYRPYWQGLTILLEGYCVGKNFQLGMSF